MTLIRPEGDDGAADRMLTAFRELFQETADEIDSYRKRMRANKHVPASELKKLKSDLRGIVQLYYKEATHLADETRRKAGIVHEYAIDFGAARQEVERRMACLRAARGPHEVSE